MTNGEKLRALREGKSLSQKEVADRLGIERTTYVKYETDSAGISRKNLEGLADIFKVSTDYILGRTNNPYQPETQNNDVLKGVRFALYSDTEDLTEEQLESVRDFVKFVRSQKKERKKQ